MNRQIVDEYEKDDVIFSIYKTSTANGFEYQAHKGDAPVSIKISVSYENLTNFKYHGSADLETEICKILKGDIDKGLVKN